MFDPVIKKLNASIEINGKYFNQDDAIYSKQSNDSFSLNFADSLLEWHFVFGKKDGGYAITSELKNTSSKTLCIGNVSPLAVNDLKLSDNSVYFYWGGLDTNYVYDASYPLPEAPSKPFLLFYDKKTEKAVIISAVSFDCVCGDFHFSQADGKCSIYFDYKNFELKSGESLLLEKLFVKESRDPFMLLDDWADEVKNYYDIKLNKEIPAGWVGWSWIDSFKTSNTEIVTTRNLEFISKHLADFGINYIWTSICQLEGGLPGNWRKFDRRNFPAGYENMVKKIRQHGLKAGFWCGAFYNCETSEDFESNKDNFFMDEQGNINYRQQWLWAYKAPEDDRPRLCYLDSSHPDTEKYLRKVFSDLHSLGIRYYMLDFLNAGLPRDEYRIHNESTGRNIAGYRRCMKAIRQTATSDTYLLTAVGSGMLNAGLVDSSRIGSDYGEGRQLMPRFASYPATFVINGSAGSAGNPNRNAVQNLAAAAHLDRKVFNINSNMLTIDKPLSRNEALVSLNLFAISGSPVMFGDELCAMDTERLSMLKKILPRVPGAPKALDMFERVYPQNEYSRIFQQKISTSWEEWNVVALFNLENRFENIKLDFAGLGLEKDCEYLIWEFWDSKYVGKFKNCCEIQIPAQSAVLLAIRKLRKHPWILATDMHCRMGQTDLENVVWDKEKMLLSGTAIRPQGEKGSIFIAAPYGWKPTDYEGLFVAKDGRDESLIIRKNLDFSASGQTAWTVQFAQLNDEERAWKEKGK